jgi:hypothetical protein
MDASHPEILFYYIHSHYSCRPSGDCGGSRDRTRNCCVAVCFTQSRLSQLSHHIPKNCGDVVAQWGCGGSLGMCFITILLSTFFLKLISSSNHTPSSPPLSPLSLSFLTLPTLRYPLRLILLQPLHPSKACSPFSINF